VPIKRIQENLRNAFPDIGELRKGGPKTERGIGEELDHWRFTSDRPEIVQSFIAAYGEEPRLLHVYLPYATVDENFEAWQEEYGSSGLMHRCDGEMMVRWRGADGKMHDDPKPCPYASGEKTRKDDKDGCVPTGRLHLILPELVRAGYVGYVTLLTGAVNDIASITASLKDAAERRKGNPNGLRGIEWTLRRHYEKISTPRRAVAASASANGWSGSSLRLPGYRCSWRRPVPRR